MSTDYTNEIGYESLLADFKRYQKLTPRGVGMKRTGRNIYLQFKTPNTSRKTYACNCSFTLDGMVEALRKSKLVKEQLESLTSEVEFWNWYDKEIKNESQLVDDQMTFIQAIIEVKRDFWNRPSRTGRKREKSSPSDQSSWDDTYGRFYKHLPEYTRINLKAIQDVIDKWNKGTKTYKGAVSAMKRLARFAGNSEIENFLGKLDVSQTKYKDLNAVTLKDFLSWRDKTLGITSELSPRARIKIRQAWLWVFSAQVVYGFRIHEVFAIKNLFEPYTTKDGVSIPALNDPDNTDNLVVLDGVTEIGTTTKTGYRIARPNIPPKYPDLLERLDIKNPLLPANKPTIGSAKAVANFYNNSAWKKLNRWDAPTTETHALRHLANVNGMQAGIPLEVRAQSMGHTPAMNDSVYKKRQGTQTTIDLLLNSNQNAIDFVTAMAEAKKLVKQNENDKQIIAKLLSVIYQKRQDEIEGLL